MLGGSMVASILALIIMCATIVFLVLWDSCHGPYSPKHIGHQRQNEQSPRDDHSAPAQKVERPKGAIAEAMGRDAVAEQQYRNAEHRYWEGQLRAARCQNRITAIGTLVGLLGLGGIGATLLLTRQSADSAAISANAALAQAKIAVASIRPWIEATITIKEGIRIEAAGDSNTPGSVGMSFTFSFENVGKTPALYFTPYMQFIPYDGGIPEGISKMMMCNFYKQIPKQIALISHGGITIFPGKTHMEPVTAVLDSRQIEKFLEGRKTKDGVLVELDGCVLYAMEGDDHVHRTPFQATIGRVSEDPRYYQKMFSVRQSVVQVFKPADVIFNDEPIGDIPAPD